MRIQNLSIRNYRQYRSLDLDLRGDKSNLVIFVGKNGTGKTNFLNALIWCLYGKEKFYNYDLTTTPIVNLGAIDAADEGDLLSCEVTLDLLFTNGVEAKLTRRADFKKSGNAAVPAGKPVFSVATLRDIAQGVRNEPKPDHWIERWVPSRLEPYFLFDGERLDNFFKETESGKIENAILQIAQIDLLARLLDHLEKVADDLYRAVGEAGTGEKMKLLNQQLQVATEQLAEGEKELKKRRSSLEAFDESVRVLEAQIGGIEKIHAEIEKRDRKTAELESISSQLTGAREKLYEWAVEAAPRALLGEALRDLATAIDTARSERRLPPPVDPSLLAGLLDEDTCVCGSSLAEGSSGRAKIEALLAEYERVGRIGEELLEVESQTRTHLAELGAASSSADVIMSRIVDWEHRYATVEDELAYLNSTLAGHDDVKVRDAQERLTNAKADRDTAHREVLKLENQCEVLRDHINETQKDIDKVAAQDDRLKRQMKEARFAKACYAAAQKLHAELTSEVREKVATSLGQHFFEMIWKPDSFRAVTMDERYKISVEEKTSGQNILDALSSGEREVLALAFSLALSEVSGYELPMVIDTPISRLSADVQTNMCDVMVEASTPKPGEEPHQLIMLMTDVEYRDGVRDALREGRPRVLNIVIDEKARLSTLEEMS